MFSQGHLFLYMSILSGALGAIVARWNEGLFWDVKSFFAVLLMLCSIILWGLSLRTLELTYTSFIYYALDGIILVIAGVFLFKEDMNIIKIISIMLVLVGVVGLNFSFSEKGLVNKIENKAKDQK